MKSLSHPKLKKTAYLCGAPGSPVRLANAILIKDELLSAGADDREINQFVRDYLEAPSSDPILKKWIENDIREQADLPPIGFESE